MNLVADLKQYIQENEYTHAYKVNTGLITLFRPVEQGVNVNEEFKHSLWQVNYAWRNTLNLSQWTVLTPSWVYPTDDITISMICRSSKLSDPHFLEENERADLSANQPVV